MRGSGGSTGKEKRKVEGQGSEVSSRDGPGRSRVTQRTVVTKCTMHAANTIINHKLAFFLQLASFAMGPPSHLAPHST